MSSLCSCTYSRSFSCKAAQDFHALAQTSCKQWRRTEKPKYITTLATEASLPLTYCESPVVPVCLCICWLHDIMTSEACNGTKQVGVPPDQPLAAELHPSLGGDAVRHMMHVRKERSTKPV